MTTSENLPPVVLIHGFATSTERTWREPGWFDLLHDAGRQAIGIDLLGHGIAPKPTEADAYVDLAGPVIDQIPDGPIDIVGYSLGARTAIEIALADPTRIRKMVLAGIGQNMITPEGTDTAPTVGIDGLAPNIIERFDALIATEGNDGPALRACLSVERPPFTPEMLNVLDIPCLVIIGSDDFAGPPEPLAEALPDSSVVILPNIDHFGLPKQFAFIDAALEFIDAVPDWS